VALPTGIDTGKVRATYRNGALELYIPGPAGSRANRIQVRGEQAITERSGAVKGNGCRSGEKAPRAERSESMLELRYLPVAAIITVGF
jgi:hypothetical protein